MAKRDISDEPEYREVSLEDFPHLDHTYYQETTRFFIGKGFSYLGDAEDVNWAHKNPRMQTCLRMLVGDAGNIQALVYHVRLKGILKISQFTMPITYKFIDLETEFTDGSFLITTNNPLAVKKSDIDLHCDPAVSLEELLEIHRERVQMYIAAKPSLRVWSANSLGEVFDSQVRQHRLRKHRHSFRKSSPHLLKKIYKHRRIILKMITVLLIGWILGHVTRDREIMQFEQEQGKQLTLEQYEANYERHKADMMRPPVPYWFNAASIMVMAGILFVGYEMVRKGGEIVLTRVLGKDFENQPDTPTVPDISSIPQVSRGRIIGKVLVFLIISGVVGWYAANRGIQRFEEGKQLTLEKYLADYEEYKEKITRPPQSYGDYIFEGIFMVGLLIGLYELGGKTAEAVTLLSIAKKIPIGTHILLNTAWLVIFFFGGSLLWILTALRLMEGVELWIKLPILFLGPVLIVNLINRLFNLIPVQCPKCGGKAYRTRYKPITYTCRECQHIHRTNVSYGRR